MDGVIRVSGAAIVVIAAPRAAVVVVVENFVRLATGSHSAPDTFF
jgi:hypothetical protein